MAEHAAPTPAQPRFGLLPTTERRLARLARAGDERAFALIFERYHQEIYRYCRAILRDADEAQDALQSTMASALRSLPGETREIALRPWLYRVAHNEALNLIRRRRDHGEVDEEALPGAPAAGAHAEARQRLRELMGDLDALPERLRAALVMRELSGLRHEEIAAALEISPGAARQAVYEARAALLELSEGRDMGCEEIRRIVSDRDGRVLRGRRVRAHLRACQSCEDFRAAIQARRADLRALAPPLPAAAATGVLGGVIGFGGTGAVVGAKTLGVVATTAAIGLGAAGITGSVDLGEGQGSGSTPKQRSETRPSSADAGSSSAPSSVPAHRAGAARDGHEGRARPGRAQHAAPQAAAPGASELAAAGGGPPASPPGSEVAGERSGGQSASPTPSASASSQAGGASSSGEPAGQTAPAVAVPPPKPQI